MKNRVVIFGAGYAGIETALTLYKKKKKEDNVEITIIDKNPYHTLLTELHEVAGNRIDDNGVIVPLRDIFKYTDIKVVQDEVSHINFEEKAVISPSDRYEYDYLVIAAGSEPNYFGIEGLKEHSFSLWSYDDAIKIREHIKDCFVKASQEKNSKKRKSLLTFAVGGGGFTGVETMGEIAQWTRVLCKEYNIDHSEVKLVLIEALPKILSVLQDEKNIEKSMKYLTEKLKVNVMLNAAVTSASEGKVTLKSGEVIETSTFIWTAGVKASCITNEIDVKQVKACRIQVDEFAETQYPNVYAIGDISAFVAEGHTLPALVEAALQTGSGAALNILSTIHGKEKQKLEPKLHGVMVCIGSMFAVSELMGKTLPVWLSIIMKYLVNVHYLFGIGGFELVFKYLKHEVLHKRHKKMLIEDHYSQPTRAMWLVPIRLFLGYSWLMEGIAKVNEGWLSTAMLAGRATDTETSASVTETGGKVFRIVADHTPGWYAWVADNFVVPNAMLFQTLIVLTEIGIGLALISGTFTFLSGLVALGLNFNFLLSTGLYETSWWYIPAALCMLGGAGRAFGVDHYLMPYLMKQWRYFVRNRRISLTLK